MTLADHWDNRYREIGAESVSWFQEQPTDSLALFAALGVTPSASVLDVGGRTRRTWSITSWPPGMRTSRFSICLRPH